MEEKKSKISNTEWILVIALLFTIDLIQIGLEWILIGVFVNWIIDLFVGMSFGLYLQLRGESMANPKRLGGFALTFLLELIPGIDELPLWGLDGIFNMFLSKSSKILKNIPGANQINDSTDKKS